jgi:hypothetical protein
MFCICNGIGGFASALAGAIKDVTGVYTMANYLFSAIALVAVICCIIMLPYFGKAKRALAAAA